MLLSHNSLLHHDAEPLEQFHSRVHRIDFAHIFLTTSSQ